MSVATMAHRAAATCPTWAEGCLNLKCVASSCVRERWSCDRQARSGRPHRIPLSLPLSLPHPVQLALVAQVSQQQPLAGHLGQQLAHLVHRQLQTHHGGTDSPFSCRIFSDRRYALTDGCRMRRRANRCTRSWSLSLRDKRGRDVVLLHHHTHKHRHPNLIRIFNSASSSVSPGRLAGQRVR